MKRNMELKQKIKAQTSAEKAKKAEEKSKAVKENKSGSKAEAKALPNTAAVK